MCVRWLCLCGIKRETSFFLFIRQQQFTQNSNYLENHEVISGKKLKTVFQKSRCMSEHSLSFKITYLPFNEVLSFIICFKRVLQACIQHQAQRTGETSTSPVESVEINLLLEG